MADPTGANLEPHEVTLLTHSSPTAKRLELGERLKAIRDDIDAVVAENTDGQIPIPLNSNAVVSGTWAEAVGGHPVKLTRTAAAGEERVAFPIPLASRSSALKGRKLTGIVAVYSVDTADVEDVRTEVTVGTVPADGTGPSAPTTVAGDDDAHYDSEHDTAVKRGDDTGAPEYHTMTMTIPEDSQFYIGDGQFMVVEFVVDGDAAPSGVVVLYALVALFSETLTDEAA